MIRKSSISKIIQASLEWCKLNIIINTNGSMSGTNTTRYPALTGRVLEKSRIKVVPRISSSSLFRTDFFYFRKEKQYTY